MKTPKKKKSSSTVRFCKRGHVKKFKVPCKECHRIRCAKHHEQRYINLKADPERYALTVAKHCERRKAKLKSDPEYRLKYLAEARAVAAKYYREDPEYRAAKLASSRARREKIKLDPVRLEAERQKRRIREARKKEKEKSDFEQAKQRRGVAIPAVLAKAASLAREERMGIRRVA
jgi:hypothetical protein